MNLQEIKTQLDALNKAVSEMETAKAEFTFTREQMQQFVAHIATSMVEAIKSEIDNSFELDPDHVDIDVSSNYSYDKTFSMDLDVNQREINRAIKEIVEGSWDEFGIMDEVDNCYSAIVQPVEVQPIQD